MNISSTEILVVLIVALIVLGPQRLPGAMKTAGKAYRDFKKMSTTVQNEINQVVNDTTSMLTDTAETFTGVSSGTKRTAPVKGNSTPAVPSNATYRPADEMLDDEPVEASTVEASTVGASTVEASTVEASTVAPADEVTDSVDDATP